MMPVEPAKLSPAGNWPDARLQEMDPLPPLAESVALYVLFTVPFGRLAVEIVSGAPMTPTGFALVSSAQHSLEFTFAGVRITSCGLSPVRLAP